MCIVYYKPNENPCRTGLCNGGYITSSKAPQAFDKHGKGMSICSECESKISQNKDVFLCNTKGCTCLKDSFSDYCCQHDANSLAINYSVKVE